MDKPAPPARRAGRPRRDEIAARTSDLLGITREILFELGYEAATLDLIARRARVSKQTIYTRYGGKAGLIRAMFDWIADHELGEDLEAEDGLPLYEGLLKRARQILHTYNAPVALAVTTISMRESRRFPEFREAMELAKQQRQLLPLTRYLARFKGLELDPETDCRAAANAFLWLLSEDMVNAAASGICPPADAPARERLAVLAARMVAQGLAPVAPARAGV